jgi:hypothetical protein
MDKRKETEAAFALFRAGEKRREEERESGLHEKSQRIARGTAKFLRVATIVLLILGIAITLPLNLIVPEELVSSILLQFPRFIDLLRKM